MTTQSQDEWMKEAEELVETFEYAVLCATARGGVDLAQAAKKAILAHLAARPLPQAGEQQLSDALRRVVAKHDEWVRQMPRGEPFDDPLTDAVENARAVLAARPAVPITEEMVDAAGQEMYPKLWMWRNDPQREAIRRILEAALAAAPSLPATSDAARDVLAERQRQVSAEGWTTAHDDEHDRGELARAAGCYAMVAGSCQGWSADTYKGVQPPASGYDEAAAETFWPWDKEWWKPKSPRRDLVRAAALLLAEIERLDRALPWESQSQPAPADGVPAGSRDEKPQPGDCERIDAALRQVWAAFDDWTEQEQMLARSVWLHAEQTTRGAKECPECGPVTKCHGASEAEPCPLAEAEPIPELTHAIKPSKPWPRTDGVPACANEPTPPHTPTGDAP